MMITSVGQLFQPNSELGMILQMLFSLSFIIYLFYAQRIQSMTMLRQVEGTLRRIKAIRDEGRQVSIQTVREIGKPERDPTPDVERFIEHFIVPPVDLDPAGIIGKLDQLLNVREEKFKSEVKVIAPSASLSELNNLEGLLVSALALNFYYKQIRHFYLLGKKTMNIYIIMQIHMILPLLMKEIEAVSSSIQAFRDGVPIGDGVGALTAAKLMRGHPGKEFGKDVVAEVPMEGRTLLITKAKGPGCNLGKPGEAIMSLLEERKGDVKVVIMIDAAGKLEGEPTGAIAEGIGAAIGDYVNKYKIEEAAKAFDVPVYAVAIKQDISHTIAPMVEELFDSTDKAVESVKGLIRDRTEEGDVVIVAGIGNTMGIAQ